MDLQLKGLRALVTGSSSGIGTSIATAFAREGAASARRIATGFRPEEST